MKRVNKIIGYLIAFSFGLGAIMQCVKSEDCSIDWSDDYIEIINKAEITEELDSRSEMETAMWNWQEFADYKTIRDVYNMKYKNRLKSSIRLEIGNGNEGSYLFIWLFDTGGNMIEMISNYNNSYDGMPFKIKQIPRSEFDILLRKLIKLNIMEVNSNAQHPTIDGSTYFISICDGGRTHQFAIYAPIFPPSSILEVPEWQKLFQKTKEQSEIIELLFNALTTSQ